MKSAAKQSRGCAKVAYLSKEDAVRGLRHVKADLNSRDGGRRFRTGKRPMQPYYCKTCGMWHVTSNPRPLPVSMTTPPDEDWRIVTEREPETGEPIMHVRKAKPTSLEALRADAAQHERTRILALIEDAKRNVGPITAAVLTSLAGRIERSTKP